MMERLRSTIGIPDYALEDHNAWRYIKEKVRREMAYQLFEHVRLSRVPIAVWPMQVWRVRDWHALQIQAEVRVEAIQVNEYRPAPLPIYVKLAVDDGRMYMLPETAVYEMTFWKRLKFLVTKRLR